MTSESETNINTWRTKPRLSPCGFSLSLCLSFVVMGWQRFVSLKI